MKPNKKFKVDQVINYLWEVEDDFNEEDDTLDEKPITKIQKTPLKSIENKINVKKQTPIKIKQIIHEESNSSDDLPLGFYVKNKIEIDLQSESSDEDIPLSTLASNKKITVQNESNDEDDDDDDDDIPLSNLVSKKGINNNEDFERFMELKKKFGEFDRKYGNFNKHLLKNSCVFLKGIHDLRNNECPNLNLTKNYDNDSSFVDDSDYEDESKVPLSPVLEKENNFVLAAKNLKRKSFY